LHAAHFKNLTILSVLVGKISQHPSRTQQSFLFYGCCEFLHTRIDGTVEFLKYATVDYFVLAAFW
jgi:hypothetical protein